MRGKKKNRKVVSLLKAPFESTTEKKPSIEGNKMLCLNGNSKNVSKCDFNAAFAIAYVAKDCNESHMEDWSNRLQFA